VALFDDCDPFTTRRRVLAAPLLAAVTLAMARTLAHAGRLDPSQTAVIALFGMAPVELQLVDPTKPAWRRF
jgi:hypothetical protein